MDSKITVYNIEGEKIGNVEMPKLFSLEPNTTLLSQYTRVYLANQRQGTRDTKDRSEVKGKSAKPYKQKGTGHARHGSKKAPSFVGGGIAHGPKPYDFSLKLSKSMKKAALKSAYALKKDNYIVIDNLGLDSVKTKSVLNLLNKLEIMDSVLFVTGKTNNNLVLSARNVQKSKVTNQASINPYDLMKYSTIILEKSVLDSIDEVK